MPRTTTEVHAPGGHAADRRHLFVQTKDPSVVLRTLVDHFVRGVHCAEPTLKRDRLDRTPGQDDGG